MSITVSYRRISPEEFAELQDNPESAEDFFYSEDSTTVDLLDRIVEARLQNNHELAQQLSDELAQQLSGQVEDALHQDDASIDAGNLDANRTQLSIEKEWQAIHYLLTGEVAFDESQAEPPLSNIVLGGTSTQFEATYGYVRYLSPDEVKESTQALHQVSRGDLRTRFDARGDAEIYAQEDEWDEENWEFLLYVLDSLIRFFDEASAKDEVILISSD